MPDYLCTELTTISIVKFNILCNYLSFEKHMQMYTRLHEYTSNFICFTTCFR